LAIGKEASDYQEFSCKLGASHYGAQVKVRQTIFALGSLLACAAYLEAQTAARRPQREVDIGAAQAPLSDAERVDLDKAVTKHDYTAEKAVLDKALAENPKSFEMLILIGRLAYLEKHPADAADALGRAGKIKELTEQDRMTLALACEFSQQPKRAREELLKLTEMAPKNAEYAYLLGRIDSQNQQTEAAAGEFAKAIKLDPNLVRAYEDLGALQEQEGHVEEAQKTYEAGANVNRKLTVPWEWSPLDLGVLELKANNFASAEKLFREALRYNPRFGWGHYYMGELLQKQGHPAEAIGELKEAVVDDPRLRQAWLALGREFARQNNKAEADRCIAIFKKLEAQQNEIKGRKN
jgi:tetratricopeptide (TPR) repeat protein